MQGRQYRKMNSRSRTPGVAGSLHRVLWVTGYVCITLGALFCTYVFPEMFRNLHSRPYSSAVSQIVKLSKVIHAAISGCLHRLSSRISCALASSKMNSSSSQVAQCLEV